MLNKGPLELWKNYYNKKNYHGNFFTIRIFETILTDIISSGIAKGEILLLPTKNLGLPDFSILCYVRNEWSIFNFPR